MRNNFILILMLLSLVMLPGCNATSRVSQGSQLLTPGMDKAQVIKMVGYPNNRATYNNNVERWYYHDNSQILVFQNDRLTALEFDQENHNKLLEIKKAKAGATKVVNTINNDTSTANNDSQPKVGRCVGKNMWGSYEKGGGCNMYGCWPAGGTCTVFGCSYNSKCEVIDCIKIPSYKCREEYP